MSALPVRDGSQPSALDALPGGVTRETADLALGLQLCRAGMLSLTRLQLALDRGDRSRVIEAVDDLNALDVSIARTVAALPAPPADERLAAATRRVREEKMALAFEKLALASGVSGPALSSDVSSRAALAAVQSENVMAEEADVASGDAATAAPWKEAAIKGAIMLAVVGATAGTLYAAL